MATLARPRGIATPRTFDVIIDNTPDPINQFSNRTGANLSTAYVSDVRTITGMDSGTTAAASFTVTNGSLIINSVPSGSSGQVINGDVIQLTGTSSGSYLTPVTVSLSVNGNFFASWTVETYAQPIDLSPGGAYAGSDLLYNLIRAGTPLQWW